jgi:MFS family permease
VFVAVSAPFVLTSLPAGRLVARVGTRAVVVGGMLIGAAGALVLTQTETDSIIPVVIGLLLIGAGFGFAFPALSTCAMEAIEESRAGLASAVYNTSRQIGIAVGTAITGSIGVHLASRDWREQLVSLPESERAQAERATDLVTGGQEQAVERLLGPEAVEPAIDSFVFGLHGAMWVAAGLILAAAVLRAVVLGRAPVRS